VETAISAATTECTTLKAANDVLLREVAELRAAQQARRASRLQEVRNSIDSKSVFKCSPTPFLTLLIVDFQCEERIASLQEQLQDLQFYNTMSKATQGNSEIAAGAIYMAAAPAPPASSTILISIIAMMTAIAAILYCALNSQARQHQVGATDVADVAAVDLQTSIRIRFHFRAS
jgi:hypothetical protein